MTGGKASLEPAFFRLQFELSLTYGEVYVAGTGGNIDAVALIFAPGQDFVVEYVYHSFYRISRRIRALTRRLASFALAALQRKYKLPALTRFRLKTHAGNAAVVDHARMSFSSPPFFVSTLLPSLSPVGPPHACPQSLAKILFSRTNVFG